MGIFVLMAVGFFVTALVSSQLPAWAAIALYAANLVAYLWVWDWHPLGFVEAGAQTIHIVILVGGQTAHMLGLFVPLVTDAIDDWPRWLRALTLGAITLPGWMILPLLFY